jgi:iron complex outermembrane receptor protein
MKVRIVFRPILLILQIITLLSVPHLSFSQQVADSVRLDEIIVTGNMSKVNLQNAPMSISVISKNQIDAHKQPSLLPILSEEVPGLFVTQRGVMGFGVASGAAGGITIRGIGGTPTSGVLVLIDGHPQFMGLMGHPLADTYLSSSTERVEVIRGPASILYGSNAMGGVVNIVTRQMNHNGIRNSVQTMYGSYNTLSANISSNYRQNGFFANADLSYNRTDGHRPNMEFDQTGGQTKAGYDFSDNWRAFANIDLSNTNASNPGTLQTPMEDNDADITRGMASFTVENKYVNTTGVVKIYYNFGEHKINDGYVEGAEPKTYLFHSNDDMMGFAIRQSYSFAEGNQTTAGFDLQRFGGKARNRYIDGITPDFKIVDVRLNDMAGYIDIQQAVFDQKLTFNGGLRIDHHEINGSEWIPQLGASYSPSSSTIVKAIVNKGFRNPTIREMYMFPTQNPDLKPERLMNYEVSLFQSFPRQQLSLGINLFYIKGSNMIQVDVVEGKPLNVNSGKVENKGLEFDIHYQATRDLHFSANYSLLNMKYKLLATPEHKIYMNGNFTSGRWNISTGIQYIGNLYTNIRPEMRKNSFVLWNCRAHYQLIKWMKLFVKGENLLNQSYEINDGYPMPGITAFGGVSIEI